MANERSKEKTSWRDSDGLHKRRGIWYYCLTIDGERRFFSTKTRNFQEARKKRAEAIRDQESNRLPTDLAKLSFEKLLAQVVEDRKPHLGESTIRLERERSVPLAKYFGGRRVSEIDGAAIKEWQKRRVKQVSARTVNLEAKLLRQVLKAAKTWAIVADDYKALPEDRRGPGRALEDHEEKILFDTARSKPEWDAAFLAALAAANTTARGCELKSLRIGDLDLIDAQVKIGKSKTEAGRRMIPLNDASRWAFARLLERANGLGSTEPEHFLFPAFRYKQTKAEQRGTGYDPNRPQKTWRTAWRSLVKETARCAGREAARTALQSGRRLRGAISAWKRAEARIRGLRFHDLRHCAITKLAESGASDQTIMSLAGHLDRSMLEHYSHIRTAAKRQAIDAIRSYVPEEKPLPASTRVQ